MPLSNKIKCDNIYWVEGRNYNYLSISQLKKSRYKFEFHHKKAKIFDANGELIGSGEETRGNLFYLDLSDVSIIFDNVLDGLPPMRCIHHCMDLIPRSSLPNKAPHRLTPKKNKESNKQVQ